MNVSMEFRGVAAGAEGASQRWCRQKLQEKPGRHSATGAVKSHRGLGPLGAEEESVRMLRRGSMGEITRCVAKGPRRQPEKLGASCSRHFPRRTHNVVDTREGHRRRPRRGGNVHGRTGYPCKGFAGKQ